MARGAVAARWSGAGRQLLPNQPASRVSGCLPARARHGGGFLLGLQSWSGATQWWLLDGWGTCHFLFHLLPYCYFPMSRTQTWPLNSLAPAPVVASPRPHCSAGVVWPLHPAHSSQTQASVVRIQLPCCPHHGHRQLVRVLGHIAPAGSHPFASWLSAPCPAPVWSGRQPSVPRRAPARPGCPNDPRQAIG